MRHESDGDTNYNWSTRNGPQRLGKESGIVGFRRTNRDHPNYSFTIVDHDTEKSPGDLGSEKLARSNIVKLSPFSQGRPEGSLFNSYYTEM